VNPILDDWLDSSTAVHPEPPASPRPVPAPVAAAEACNDPDCARCSGKGPGAVAEAGARALCSQIGLTYDDLDRHTAEHYKHIAGQVYAAMSETLLTTGAVHEKET
jgi:hypothetical protein